MLIINSPQKGNSFVASKVYFAVLFLFLSSAVLSQSKEKTIFNIQSVNGLYTLEINMRNYPKEVAAQLKDDLSEFDGKVESVEYLEDKELIVLVYNEAMPIKELNFVFEENNVAYLDKKEITKEIKQ